MNTDGTGFHTCKECHITESLWNHTTTDHKEGEQLEDQKSVGARSCNSGDGTDQRVRSLMFMMMIIYHSSPYGLYQLQQYCSLIFFFFNYFPECCNLSEDIQQLFWHSLLMACRRYIQWYISYLIAITNGWVWRGLLITHNATQSVGLLLDEWSARPRDLYLTTCNTHNRQTSMPPVGFEPTTPAGERP